MNEWRLIETAPKCAGDEDPVLFLGFVPHSMGGYMSVFYWNSSINKWQNNTDGETDKPTHWMPLPSAPTRYGSYEF